MFLHKTYRLNTSVRTFLKEFIFIFKMWHIYEASHLNDNLKISYYYN